jgi:hypothetical protein
MNTAVRVAASSCTDSSTETVKAAQELLERVIGSSDVAVLEKVRFETRRLCRGGGLKLVA